MNIYILQKDLPNVPKGAIFQQNCFGNYNCLGLPNLMYPEDIVENNPEWFKLKEEKIKVSFKSEFDNYYNFCASNKIPSEKLPSIAKAIEFILNDEKCC